MYTKQTTLYNRNGWRLISYGRGSAYLLEDTLGGVSAYFQGDDAFAFRQRVFCGEWLRDDCEQRFEEYASALS